MGLLVVENDVNDPVGGHEGGVAMARRAPGGRGCFCGLLTATGSAHM